MQENTQQKKTQTKDKQMKDRKADDDTLASNPEGVETTDKADLEGGAKKDKAHKTG